MRGQVLLAAALLASGLLAGCTGSGDGDGLDAQVETNGWVVRVTYPNQTEVQYQTTSDPSVADTDGDGLNDFQELQVNADPRKIDTDHDRLLDGSMQCPEAGSALADAILEQTILEHPEKTGCYLGESSWTYRDLSINTKPTDAHSDNSVRIGDNLTDSRELIGWNVTAQGRTYHVISNPSTHSPDSDSDGLHDGLELELKADPVEDDTDGDGVNDLQDAAPLGNLVVTAKLERINLKDDKKLGGGADLIWEVQVGQEKRKLGPKSIPSGSSNPNLQATFDVPDQATDFDGGHGAENWEGKGYVAFWHDRTGSDDEPIRVRSGDSGHIASYTFHAFEGTIEGELSGGTANGPDASVTVSLTSRVET